MAVDSQDCRKVIDGLAGVAAAAAIGRDSASGDLFVSRNRHRDRPRFPLWLGD